MPPGSPSRRGPLLALAALALALGAAELIARLTGAGSEPIPEPPFGGADAEALVEWQGLVGARGAFLSEHEHDPDLGWVPRRGLRDFVAPGHPPKSTNSAGLRGTAEFELAPAPDVLRIATVGDSFTFGTHQPDGRIWPARLAEALGAQGAGRAEVLNFGVPGYGTDQAVLRLERDVLAYRPDVVVWGVFETNPQRSRRLFSFYAKPRFALDGDLLTLEHTPVPPPEALLAVDPFDRAGGAALHLLRWIRLAAVEAVGPGAPPQEALHRALLARAARACEAAGAELLVVPIPTLRFAELEAPPHERATRELAQSLPYAMLDLRATFRRSTEGPAPPIYIPGRHFSPEGHWLVANAVAGRLAELGWITPGSR